MAATYSERGTWRDRVVAVTDGAKVIACGRNEVTLRQLQNENPTIEAVRCDITVRQDVLALATAIRDRHGRLDVLINNAGIMEQVDLLDEKVGDDRIANEIAINLTGPIVLTRRLLPLLRMGRDPLIAMISSGYALLPATRAPTYSASKAGLHSFTMALRRQLAGDVGRCIGPPGVARYRKWPGREPPRKGRAAADSNAVGTLVHRTPRRGDVTCLASWRHLRCRVIRSG